MRKSLVSLLVLALAPAAALACGLTLRQRERRAINRYAAKIHGHHVGPCELYRPYMPPNVTGLLCAVSLTPRKGVVGPRKGVVGLLALPTPNGHIVVYVHSSGG